MKYTIDPESTFKPITLRITLETQVDVDAYYALFNSGLVREAIKKLGSETGTIWESLKQFHEEDCTGAFNNSLTFTR